MSQTTQVRIAQIFATGSAAWLSGSDPSNLANIMKERSADRGTGYIASMTIAGIPAAATAPPNVAPKQWRTIYDIGVSSAPKIAALSAASFAYAAYSISSVPGDFKTSTTSNPVYLLSAAAVSTIMIAPWTLLTMLSTNEALDAKLAAADTGIAAKEDDELYSLLKTWAGLNGVRSVFPAIGAMIGLWVITS